MSDVPFSATLGSQASWLTSPSAVTPIEVSADAPAWAAHFAVPTAAELGAGGSQPALPWSTPTHGQTPSAAAVPDRGAYEVQQATQGNPPSSASGETFDSAGQITSIKDALGDTIKASYDGAERLTSVTDPPTVSHPNGNTTTWTYNDQNRVTSQTTALGTSSFAYASPSCGNLVQYTDADGRVTTYQYDSQDHATGEQWYVGATDAGANSGAGQNAQDAVHYSYDPSTGDLVAEWDATSADYYTYTGQGQLYSAVECAAGAAAVELSYSYYDNCQCSGVTALKQNGQLPQEQGMPIRKAVSRRRLRSVIQDLMYLVARWTRHAHRRGLSFWGDNPWHGVWERLYERFSGRACPTTS